MDPDPTVKIPRGSEANPATVSTDGDPRRSLPSVDRLLRPLLGAGLPAWAARGAAREVLAEARKALERGEPAGDLQGLARERAAARLRIRPARVINATGVVLHTNLGRAPLAPAAAAAVAAAAAGYADVELDLARGERGGRQAALHAMLCELSGAEDALVVNNNAAAVLLALAALARGREVIVSRGELVEIGGSFRVPEILLQAGVTLREVGTTNRTHLRDYAGALGERTGALLKVHRSNFEQRGFTSEVGLAELVALGREHGIPVIDDLGSGTLVDLRAEGLPAEAYVPLRVADGADLVCFSGDKLLGGPQAGIVLGRAPAVDALRHSPLARALRTDKLGLAALHATLRLLLEGRREELPVVRMLTEPVEKVAERARTLASELSAVAGDRLRVEVEPTRGTVGGGSLPGFELPSAAVVLADPQGGASALAARLRRGSVPVLARVRGDRVWLDARTLLADEPAQLVAALEEALV